MKVRELIELLKTQDPDAEVTMVFQPNWPLEYALAGVAVRSELLDRATQRLADGTAATDVVLVQGRQLGYGQRTAWEASRWLEREPPCMDDAPVARARDWRSSPR